MGIKIDFEGLYNTRDLGGAVCGEYEKITTGKLFRSSLLASATDNDVSRLGKMISTVVDFRTEKEIAERPDAVIPGVKYYHVPIISTLAIGITRDVESEEKANELVRKDPEIAKKSMIGMYRAFVNDEYVRGQCRRFLDILLSAPDTDGGILWHCTAGKDRAGFCTAVVQKILGADDEYIKNDYLLTNIYNAEDVRKIFEMIRSSGTPLDADSENALHYLFDAREEYIDALYDEAGIVYGGFDRYIRDGLGIDGDAVREMRRKYLI